MNTSRNYRPVRLTLAMFATSIFFAPAFSQELLKNPLPSPTPAPGALVKALPPETGSGSRPKNGALDEVEELKKKVDQLQSLVEQQQLSLAEMAKQLAELKAQPASAPSSVSQPDASANSLPAAEKDAVAASPSTASTGQSPGAQPQEPKSLTITAGLNTNHPYLRSSDGNFETNLGGVVQLDFHGYAHGSNHPPNTFLIRRARLYLEGKVFRYFDFRIEGDLADTSNTILRDGWVSIHRIDQFQLTFGQFKEPFSQEELRYDAYQSFIERSLVNNLVPSRSPGLMASGSLGKGIFEYQLGAFNGKGLLAQNTSGTPENALRLRFTPLKKSQYFWLKGFSFGGASAYGRGAGGSSVRGLTESRSVTFFAPDTVSGKILRTNGELTWLLGPAIIRAEYDQTNQERRGLGPHGTSLPGVVAKGYMGQFTYLLTGENKPDSAPVTPKHNVFGDEDGKFGLGAWELKVRYSNLQISDSTAKSNRADTIYFGPNWYLNRFVRYLLDIGFERFRDPSRTPRPGDKNFFVILSRVQFAF